MEDWVGMLYSDLAETFDRLESTGSRLEMTSILAGFFGTADKGELRSIVYLSQGKLHPDFVPGVLGMADRRIYTSDRRFPKGTIPKLKLMWKMNRLRKLYRDGMDTEDLARMYRDVR